MHFLRASIQVVSEGHQLQQVGMKPVHSDSLLFVWQVANLEAKRLQAAFLEPAHFFLGLCKAVDLDVTTAIPQGTPNRDALLEEMLREFRILRDVFREAGVSPALLRRRYRTLLPEGSAGLNPAAGTLRRSGAARDVFAEAEQAAQVSGGVVYPLHLLHCLLAGADPLRDQLFKDVQSDTARLRAIVRQRVFFQAGAAGATKAFPDTQWN